MKNFKVPNHLAIIMDGNGRWAKKRRLPRNIGHQKGSTNLKDVSVAAKELGVKYLTVYAFSTENWKRPKEELDKLMQLPIDFYEKYKDQYQDNNTRIMMIGRRDRIRKDLLEKMEKFEEETKNNKDFTLIIAFDYGSRDEITNAMNNIIKDNHKEVTEDTVSKYLYTNNIPDVDLLIRTSGEERISNYLLWQIAYSELYFTKKHWPSFNKKDLIKAFKNYSKRNRRFGGLKEE